VSQLDPVSLFARIAEDVPSVLHKHLFVTGSLAAAYHFRAQIEGRAVNTKDADVVVHPSGNVESSRRLAECLLEVGWSRHAELCYARPSPVPREHLRAIRLFPPASMDYFLELLNLPKPGQVNDKEFEPVQLHDGWYGLPSFRFHGLLALNRLAAENAIEYSSPEMMALANLLAHRRLSDALIESEGPTRGRRRCAKDLGRVIVLARLAGRQATEPWPERWLSALQTCYPVEWRDCAGTCGDGLRELLSNRPVMEDAWHTAMSGLLSGTALTIENLRASAERLLADVIEIVEQAA
jgi:hypothetical protein